jgi:ParB-like chromosome segregation protein Spo0J
MELVKIDKIKPNPKNPRVIKDNKFEQLKKSIQEFPEMLEKRPLVCFTDADGKFVVLGGNMRLKASKEVGLKELPVILADDWTEEQKNEFLIKDNVSFGEHDWEALSDWDSQKLSDWGLDVPEINSEKLIKEKKETKPYKKTHILISFSPEKIDEVKEYLEKIIELDFIEYEQASN